MAPHGENVNLTVSLSIHEQLSTLVDNEWCKRVIRRAKVKKIVGQ